MRLYCLIILLLGVLLTCAPARAQGSTAIARPAAAVPAAPDTAAALHRLFVAKRGLRTTVILGTVLTGGTALALDALFASDSRNGLVGFATQSRIVGTTSLILLVELLAHNRYNRREEQTALASWRLHYLAPDLRRQLKPRYFAPAAPAPRP